MNTAHLVRASDPLSSVLAAEAAPKFAGSHCERIMEVLEVCLQICPNSGATAREIGMEAGLSVVQVDRRLPELQRAGRVRVIQQFGHDLMRGGYRCWTLVRCDTAGEAGGAQIDA